MRIGVLLGVVALAGCEVAKGPSPATVGTARARLIESPTVSEEFEPGELPVGTIAETNTLMAASGGGMHLVVFRELESGKWFAHRIADDGSDLDPPGIPIPTFAGVAGVAFVGSRFLVEGGSSLWIGTDGIVADATFNSGDNMPASTAVGASGFATLRGGSTYPAVLNRYDFTGAIRESLSLGVFEDQLPPFAFSRGVYWTAAATCSNDGGVQCGTGTVALIGIRESDGSRIATTPVSAAGNDTPRGPPLVACGSDTCILAWRTWAPGGDSCQSQDAVYAMRFDGASGAFIDAAPVLLASDATPVAADADGDSFLVGVRSSAGLGVVRLTKAGLGTRQLIASQFAAPTYVVAGQHLVLTFDGSSHLAYFQVRH